MPEVVCDRDAGTVTMGMCCCLEKSKSISDARQEFASILIEKTRMRQTLQRGGGQAIEPLDEATAKAAEKDHQLLRLDEALEGLEAIDARKANLVKMRYFVGMTNDEIADALEIHVATVARDWAYARAWLKREMGPSEG